MPASKSRQILEAELDPLLQPLLAAIDEAQIECALAELLAVHAEPRVRRIVGYKLRTWAGSSVTGSDAEDVCGEIMLKLVTRLRDFKTDPSDHAISHFGSYVAVTAFRTCHDHLRRRYPQRYALKHRVRYALRQHPELACWEPEPEQWTGGLAIWRAQSISVLLARDRVAELRAQPEEFVRTALPHSTIRDLSLPQLLLHIFHQIGQPVELDDLVGLVATLQGINDQSDNPALPGEDVRLALERLPERRASQADELEQQHYLTQLWQELCQMPARHRAALLLNLRDDQGGSALDLFLFTGIVTLPQIAAALEMTKTELLELWNRLPLDDAMIAERLGLRRQQVINLRQAARKRLRRRLHT